MPNEKNVSIEIVRQPSPVDIKALIDQAVKERVAEALSVRETDQLGPSYLPKEIAIELRRHQTMFDRERGALYFAKWGCQRCGRKKGLSHASNGNCEACSQILFRRNAQLRREYDASHPESQIAENIKRLDRGVRVAGELLQEAPEEETGRSHQQAVSDYHKRNLKAGKCAYCPRPLAPNSTLYCEECLGKKRERKRKRREKFEARLRAALENPTRRFRSARELPVEGEK